MTPEHDAAIRSAVLDLAESASPPPGLADTILRATVGAQMFPAQSRAVWKRVWLPLAASAAVAATAIIAVVLAVGPRTHAPTPPATNGPTVSSIPTTNPPSPGVREQTKQLGVPVGDGSVVTLTVPTDWTVSRTQPTTCCNQPPTTCLVSTRTDWGGDPNNCVLTITEANPALGLSPDVPRPTPSSSCSRWTTSQESGTPIQNRPTEYREFVDRCTGATSEMWSIMSSPQIAFWHPITPESPRAKIAAVLASAVLPPVTDARRQVDDGYLRAMNERAGTYTVTIGRVVVSLDGTVIDESRQTYDYPLSGLVRVSGGARPCVSGTTCDPAQLLAQFGKGPNPSDGATAVDGAVVELHADGAGWDLTFIQPEALNAVATACLSLTSAQALAMLGESGISLDAPHGYACSGIWAYVNYVRHQPQVSHSTRDLEYVNGRWAFADRAVACGTGTRAPAMPPSLVAWGCGN